MSTLIPSLLAPLRDSEVVHTLDGLNVSLTLNPSVLYPKTGVHSQMGQLTPLRLFWGQIT